VLRGAPSGTRLARAQALKTYFEFVELRHKVEIHQMTGRVVECPIDEMNRPRGRRVARLRIPPTAEQVGQLFAGWRGELATCRKFGPAARNYAAVRLMSQGRASDQRAAPSGSGGYEVGSGPVRQNPCSPRQGHSRLGDPGNGWCR
jgi:hypothetical protein